MRIGLPLDGRSARAAAADETATEVIITLLTGGGELNHSSSIKRRHAPEEKVLPALAVAMRQGLR